MTEHPDFNISAALHDEVAAKDCYESCEIALADLAERIVQLQKERRPHLSENAAHGVVEPAFTPDADLETLASVGRPPALSVAQIDAARTMRGAGLSDGAIAVSLGVHRNTIRASLGNRRRA